MKSLLVEFLPSCLVAIGTLLACLWIMYWWLRPALASANGVAALSKKVADIHGRLELHSRLLTFDPLTDLPNGRALEQALPDALRRARELRHPLTLAFLDLDGFKEVNDTRGHQAGDQLLVSAARAIRCALRRFRGTDRVYRPYPSGDEFVILLAGADGERARYILAQVLTELEEIGVSASIGALTLPSGGGLASRQLIEQADQLMQLVKRAGGGSVHLKVWQRGHTDRVGSSSDNRSRLS